MLWTRHDPTGFGGSSERGVRTVGHQDSRGTPATSRRRAPDSGVTARVLAIVLGALMALGFVLPLQADAAVTIPQTEAGIPAQMDSQKYSETVQVPVTLYDYGNMVGDTWITNDPTVLNQGLAGGNGVALSDLPKTMRFWDYQWRKWDPAGDPSSMFDSNGNILRGGYFAWGLFEREFTDWSSVIAVPSRDLFGKSEESCSYDGKVFKQVFDGVMMDFSYDPTTNTYHYSSNESSATFNGTDRIIKTELGSDATTDDVGFWPFGKNKVHFGMTMDFTFYLPSEEYLASNEYYFAFSGDDDLVVYVDDKLALDLGGAHPATAGYIDFANEIVVYGKCSYQSFLDCFEDSIASSGIEMKRSGFEQAGVDWNMETLGYVTFEELGIDLENSSEHQFRLAYLERGGDASNLMIEMNMELSAQVDYEVVGDVAPNPSYTDSVPVENSKLHVGDAYTALPGLSTDDPGYTFAGWFEDFECKVPWEDGTALVATNTTLYGKWYYGKAIKSSDPSPGQIVVPMQEVSYTVSYVNEKDYSEKVRITDQIPELTAYVDGSAMAIDASGLGVITENVDDGGSGSVECVWESVAPGEQVSLQFSVIIDMEAAGLEISNDATVDIDDGAIVYTTPLVKHPVDDPVLYIWKSSDPPSGSEVETGDTIFYTITVANGSNAAIGNIVISDPIPEGTTLVEDSVSHWIGSVDYPVDGDMSDFAEGIFPIAEADEATSYESGVQTSVLKTDELLNVDPVASSESYTAYSSQVVSGVEDGEIRVDIATLDPGMGVSMVFAVTVDEMDEPGTREIVNVAQVDSPSLPGGPVSSNETVHNQELVEQQISTTGGKKNTGLPTTGDVVWPIAIALICVGAGIAALVATLRSARSNRATTGARAADRDDARRSRDRSGTNSPTGSGG